MNDEQQLKELRETINDVLSRWAPFPNDPHEHKVMRALLHLAAYEKETKRVLAGEQPIRTNYPLPLPKDRTENKLFIFSMDCSFRGSIIAVTDTEENAREIMKTELNYDSKREIIKHEIVHGFRYADYGDM